MNFEKGRPFNILSSGEQPSSYFIGGRSVVRHEITSPSNTITGNLDLSGVDINGSLKNTYSVEGNLDLSGVYINGSLEYTPPSTSITQHEFTWTFDQLHETGQFANGDYWVVGPVNIVSITPQCQYNATADGWINGTMVDPEPSQMPSDVGQHQGFSANAGPYYDEDYNDALPNGSIITSGNVLTVTSGSIVSSYSTPDGGTATGINAGVSYENYLRSAAVLTVVPSAPADGSFRPAAFGTDKSIPYNESELNYTLLQSNIITSGISTAMQTDARILSIGSVSTDLDCLNNVADFFEKLWVDYAMGPQGRNLHPLDSMPEYGANIANFVGIASTMLHMNFTNEQKRNLLVRFMQYGIDIYGVAIADGGRDRWIPNGGQNPGRKWPVVFAGLVLGDPTMASVNNNNTPSDPGFNDTVDIAFQEDWQTFYVTQAEVDMHAPYSHDSTDPDYLYVPPADYTIPTDVDSTADVTAAVDTGDGFIQVSSTSPFSIRQYIRINSEWMYITSIDSNLNVDRGKLGTSTSTHSISDSIYISNYNAPDDWLTHGETQANMMFYPYRSRDLGLADYSAIHWGYADGPIDNDSIGWDIMYRFVNSPAWGGFILGALMTPNGQSTWSYNPLFDYVDRWVVTQPSSKHDSTFVESVWDEYRDDYGSNTILGYLLLDDLNIDGTLNYTPTHYYIDGNISIDDLDINGSLDYIHRYSINGNISIDDLVIDGSLDYSPKYFINGNILLPDINIDGAFNYIPPHYYIDGNLSITDLDIDGSLDYTPPHYYLAGNLNIDTFNLNGNLIYIDPDTIYVNGLISLGDANIDGLLISRLKSNMKTRISIKEDPTTNVSIKINLI
ncbi:MAG: hypothetical protein GY853_09865 [PVC group bacterium]|nr:hypothetical protein [PVC group bacterium]